MQVRAGDVMVNDYEYRADLLPPHALLEITHVLKKGAIRYGDTNYHKVPVNDHINHAIVHLLYHLSGENTPHHPEYHLAHAATRLLFALQLNYEENT